MLVVRGRRAAVDADHAETHALLDAVGEDHESAVRAWRPPRQIAFGPRDVQHEGYERARAVARERGYPAYERTVGGRAVGYTGSTVAFALVERTADAREGLHRRYDRVTARLQAALAGLGVRVEPGEPPGAFCPGTQSLSATGKLVGLAQRVRRNRAVTAGVVVPRDHRELAAVLEPVYDALDVSFEADAVGSLRRAGSDATPAAVARAVEDALVGDVDPAVREL